MSAAIATLLVFLSTLVMAIAPNQAKRIYQILGEVLDNTVALL
jgi:uncharacterized protein YjeT (DUF2065 family)